jgi:hypothetical protein
MGEMGAFSRTERQTQWGNKEVGEFSPASGDSYGFRRQGLEGMESGGCSGTGSWQVLPSRPKTF